MVLVGKVELPQKLLPSEYEGFRFACTFHHFSNSLLAEGYWSRETKARSLRRHFFEHWYIGRQNCGSAEGDELCWSLCRLIRN